MTPGLLSIHEYLESDGWEAHWESQSFETACDIRDSIAPDRNPLIAATGEPTLPFAVLSQRFTYTNEFPMDHWRLVSKEYSKRSAIRLRDEISHGGVEIARVAQSWDSNLPRAVMATNRTEGS